MTIEKLRLPVGRIVWGNPARSQKKVNYTTKQPVLKDGQTVDEWVCGVAYDKATFNTHILPYMQREVATAYPNGVPRDFSWKYRDGDGIDEKGQPYNKREGHAGHFILTISTEAFAPPIYKFENGAYRQIAAEELKTGDYVVANLDMKVHTNNSGGLYINPNCFELVGYGTEIKSAGVDPTSLLGGVQHQLPPGASAVPMSSAPVGAGMPMQQPAAPQQYAAPAQYNAPLPAPAYDMVGMHQPAAPQQYAPAPQQYAAPAPAQYAAGLPPQQPQQGGYAAPVTGYPNALPTR